MHRVGSDTGPLHARSDSKWTRTRARMGSRKEDSLPVMGPEKECPPDWWRGLGPASNHCSRASPESAQGSRAITSRETYAFSMERQPAKSTGTDYRTSRQPQSGVPPRFLSLRWIFIGTSATGVDCFALGFVVPFQ